MQDRNSYNCWWKNVDQLGENNIAIDELVRLKEDAHKQKEFKGFKLVFPILPKLFDS